MSETIAVSGVENVSGRAIRELITDTEGMEMLIKDQGKDPAISTDQT